MNAPRIVSRTEWLAERTRLLEKEKALTRQRDALATERRRLPWEAVEKDYVFEGSAGRESLADLFAGRSQLIVKHFMFAPGWPEGCVGCSFEVDHIDPVLIHLGQRDVTFVAVSRAPLAQIEAFKARMGWRFKWVSSDASDFNYDYQVSFRPAAIASGKVYYNYAERDFQCEELSGFSVFARDAAGRVFHTYSVYGRGAEEVLGTYMLLDLLPKGREETGPRFDLTDWVRHHDRYDTGDFVDAMGRYRTGEGAGCCAGETPAP